MPAVVGAVMWSFLLEPQFGPFVHLANALGFGGTNFFSSNLILPSIIVIVIWEWTGYNMVILYTALRSVPRDVVEAAILDDTPLWKIILRVKLPMVRPAIVLLVFINTIGALQLFTEPLILQYFETQADLGQLHADPVHLQHRDRRRPVQPGRGGRGDPRRGHRGHLGQLAVRPPPQGRVLMSATTVVRPGPRARARGFRPAGRRRGRNAHAAADDGQHPDRALRAAPRHGHPADHACCASCSRSSR